MLIDLAGYAKVNLIFNMGKAFSKLGMWEKADFYFEILRNTSFEISPATVSSFYKAIAELYLDAGKKGTSFSCRHTFIALMERNGMPFITL